MSRGVPSFDGAALRDARKQAECPIHDHHALTADCLALIVGTSKALILSYEHGRSSPSPHRLQELARAVGQHPAALQRPNPQVSDLRVAAGWTASELASALDLAVNTYRRIETEGLMPRRRPSVLWDLIRALRVDYTRVRAALSQIPAVQERWTHATEILAPLIAQAQQPGEFQQLQDTSVQARQLALVYEARPAAVSKLVNLQLGELRQLLSRRAQLQARLDFAHAVPRRMLQYYNAEVARFDKEIRTTEGQFPDLLEHYLVHPLSQECWAQLSKLYMAGPDGLELSPTDETLTALEKVFDNYLLERIPTSARPHAVSLSMQGALFCLDTLPYYRALYQEDGPIRPRMEHYGWPRVEAETQRLGLQLRSAHIMGFDPDPHWREGERIIRRSRPSPSGGLTGTD